MAKHEGSGIFFTGKGVLRHKDVDYRNGQELPADLPAATIASLKAKGNASDTRPERPSRGPAQDPRVAELQGTVTAMEEAAERGMARIAELEKNSVEREELTVELAIAQTTIEQLTAQITGGTTQAPEAPAAEGGAGPKK